MTYNLTITTSLDGYLTKNFIVKQEASSRVDAIRKALTKASKMEEWTDEFEDMIIECYEVKPKIPEQGRLIA